MKQILAVIMLFSLISCNSYEDKNLSEDLDYQKAVDLIYETSTYCKYIKKEDLKKIESDITKAYKDRIWLKKVHGNGLCQTKAREGKYNPTVSFKCDHKKCKKNTFILLPPEDIEYTTKPYRLLFEVMFDEGKIDAIREIETLYDYKA